MCRLTAYIGTPLMPADLVTRPNRSIIAQSYSARERVTERGYLNADGFGLGWYPVGLEEQLDAHVPVKPCTFTSTGPAWNSKNLSSLAESIVSPIVFAHVRAASPGLSVCNCSCHPFQFGRYMFMHNGMIGNFTKVRRRLLNDLSEPAYSFAVEKGDSDSALCFGIFINELDDINAPLHPDEFRMKVECVIEKIKAASAAENITDISMLNLVISDGNTLIATRYLNNPTDDPNAVAATLYFASGTRYECKDKESGEYRMVHADRRDNLAIITSEPLTNHATDWVPVPPNHIIVVTDDHHVLLWEHGLLSEGISTSLNALSDIPSREQKRYERASIVQSYAGEAMGIQHCFQGHTDSVLALTFAGKYVFSGSQDSTIRVWDPQECKCLKVLEGHEGSVLALASQTCDGESYIFSSSSDSSMRKWEAKPPFKCIAVVHFRNMGHVMSLAVASSRVYGGFMDTQLRFVAMDGNATMDNNADLLRSKFGRQSTHEIRAKVPNLPSIESSHDDDASASCCCGGDICGGEESRNALPWGSIPVTDVGTKFTDHFSYVLTLATCGEYLCSGGGDGFVKVWNPTTLECVSTLTGHGGSVMTLTCTADGKTLFSGSRDGSIKVWDMDGLCCKRTLKDEETEILSLCVANDILYSGSEDGQIVSWSCKTFKKIEENTFDSGAIQSLTSCPTGEIFSGGKSTHVYMWKPTPHPPQGGSQTQLDVTKLITKDTIVDTLRAFVAFRSVSGEEAFKEHCWNAAKFLKAQLKEITCSEATLIPCGEGKNPIVYGRLIVDQALPTVLVYGHYDVQPAVEPGWNSHPWSLTPVNEYLYGRGASDDKGPIVATIFAIKELLSNDALGVNVIFVYEGEEECASEGFREAVATLKQTPDWPKDIAMVLISNNYWIGEDRPCLTYGMRGIMNFTVTVNGPERNLHSGVDGGAVIEPLQELIQLFATLSSGDGRITIPGFYDDVVPVTEEEEEMLQQVDLCPKGYKESLGVEKLACEHGTSLLKARWREPSLSVANLSSSNTDGGFSIIPKSATGKISVRFVPDQNPEKLSQAVIGHLEREFSKRRTGNQLEVVLNKTGDWWLGDHKGKAFTAAGEAVKSVWGKPPLLVREGGTMPITSFLVSTLHAPALHLPLGQASDSAHLANERIRLINLLKGKDVIVETLKNLSASS